MRGHGTPLLPMKPLTDSGWNTGAGRSGPTNGRPARAGALLHAGVIQWCAVALAAACLLAAHPLNAQGLPDPLTAMPGDPVRGETIVTDPQHGLCTLCHAGPFPQATFTGNLGPDLTGVGARRDVPDLRQQIVDSRIGNPDTIMPPYFTTDGLVRVGAGWQGTTLLNAQEVEDVVAYLASLTGDTP